jgi:hypothetical protein
VDRGIWLHPGYYDEYVFDSAVVLFRFPVLLLREDLPKVDRWLEYLEALVRMLRCVLLVTLLYLLTWL